MMRPPAESRHRTEPRLPTAELRRIARGERPIESWTPIALDAPGLAVDTTRGWNPLLERITAFATGAAEDPSGRAGNRGPSSV
ncbi:hypothetical protein ACFVVA_39960 [Kitasatospora sp. NPDC058048]|uniref:hypothetical protein n=1 Tax=Kitasatospora sp. NPDC058048 TaxID=3346313 RepID=UPI0036DF9696